MTSSPVRSVSLAAMLSVSALVVAAQAPPSRDFVAWLEAVETHAPGERDEAVARVAPWSLGQVESVLAEVRRSPPAGQLRTIGRALVLHADVAILNRETAGYNLPAGEASVTLLSDGRAVGQMSDTVHWEFARRLIERAPEGEDRLRIARAFYRATGAILQWWGEYPELTTHLAAGRRLLGDDPVLLLYEGTMRQAYAGARLQRFFDERRRAEARERPTTNTRLPPATTGTAPIEKVSLPEALPSASDSRAQAERLFRRALALDPALAEARIRLAHVVGDGGRHDAAAAELERAARERLPPLLDYYASLLTGREARARGQFDAARTGFERAAGIYPNAPAPKYGLSELAIARHDGSQGLAHLLASEAAGRAEPNEPWWWIDRAHDPSAQTLIGELRGSAAR